MRAEQTNGFNLQQTYLELPEIFYTKHLPNQVDQPVLRIFNENLAKELGIVYHGDKESSLADILAGNRLPDGAKPIAQAYAGHQFGHFTMLGDGRNILLGEQLSKQSERFDIALKGAGRTFYSRGGDGKAALGPMLREYIISEAMHALSIPTTRSLAVVSTGEAVFREKPLQGAVLVRIAASHIRVGTFEFALHWGNKAELKKLANYTIERHYPHLIAKERRYEDLLKEVVQSQAKLIAQWQLVGFVHGVMNTDNMAISGETIDYGPCAFLDEYVPASVFSSIDDSGRYAYANQPYIAEWNITRFAETLLSLFELEKEEAVEKAKQILATFYPTFEKEWYQLAGLKLGIDSGGKKDKALIKELFTLMEKFRADFTNTFYALTTGLLENEEMFKAQEFQHWHSRWLNRLEQEEKPITEIRKTMQNHNPTVIPRNYFVEQVIETAVKNNDMGPFMQLLEQVMIPFDYENINKTFQHPPKRFNQAYRTFCGT